jgi:hypothetical protein
VSFVVSPKFKNAGPAAAARKCHGVHTTTTTTKAIAIGIKKNVPLPLRSSAIHRLEAICIGYVMFTPTNGNKRPGPPLRQQQRQQFSQADVTVLRELRDVWKIRQRI